MVDDSEIETAFKVVAIMQTVSEELDERSKRMWRKMLGLESKNSVSEKSDEKRLSE